jgi:hypothetical protein
VLGEPGGVGVGVVVIIGEDGGASIATNKRYGSAAARPYRRPCLRALAGPMLVGIIVPPPACGGDESHP